MASKLFMGKLSIMDKWQNFTVKYLKKHQINSSLKKSWIFQKIILSQFENELLKFPDRGKNVAEKLSLEKMSSEKMSCGKIVVGKNVYGKFVLGKIVAEKLSAEKDACHLISQYKIIYYLVISVYIISNHSSRY